MIRVAFGWIGGAGRQPARAQGPPERAVGVERAVGLDLRVDPQVRDPAGGVRQVAPGRASVKAPIVVGRPVAGDRAARRVGEAPTASVAAGGRGSGRRSRCRVGRRRRRAIRWAVQPLTALTAAQPDSCRYEPGSLASTNASQDVGIGGRHDLTRAADHVDHDPDDRRQFGDPQHERDRRVGEPEDEARRATTSTIEDEPPGIGADGAADQRRRPRRRPRRRRALPTTASIADADEAARARSAAGARRRIDEQRRAPRSRPRSRSPGRCPAARTARRGRPPGVQLMTTAATAARTGVTVSWRA